MNQPARAVDRDHFLRGALFGMVLMIGVEGLHWMITDSAHPGASTLRRVLVVIQTVASFSIAAWLYYKAGRSSAGPEAAASD